MKPIAASFLRLWATTQGAYACVYSRSVVLSLVAEQSAGRLVRGRSLLVETDKGLDETEGTVLDREAPPSEAGFIKFYGLYWSISHVDWSTRRLLGQPSGWIGKGKVAKSLDRADLQMNFWGQKGVYILYDDNLHPVYAGQAGLTRKKASEGQTIGNRLHTHSKGIYRNGWTLFSWFGFMSTNKIDLRKSPEPDRMEVPWTFSPNKESTLNDVLASFEAIVIEGFAPRFNARGGDLRTAVLVDQFEPPAG
jgi:hypothetical protein